MTDKSAEQQSLLEVAEWWEEHWQGMPEYVSEDLSPCRTIFVHFETEEDVATFAELVDQTITPKTKYLWYPKAEIRRFADKRYVDES